MRIFITGIAGFIGSNLAEKLINLGHNVFGIDDLSSGNLLNLPQNFVQSNLIIGDITDEYRKIKCDLIIHLATRKIPRYTDPRQTLEENIFSMINIVEYAKFVNADILFTSSSDIYGKQKEFNEDSYSIIGNPFAKRWSYSITKMWCEQYLFANKDKIKFKIIRPFGTYGERYALSWTAGPQSVFISQALKKEPITIHGDGQQTRCFQYISDLIDGIILVINSDYNHEIFNIGNPYEETSILDMAKLIWNIVNPDDNFKYISIDGTDDGQKQDVNKRIPDISKAKRYLGFEPKISLKDGLLKTIKWQKLITKKERESPPALAVG